MDSSTQPSPVDVLDIEEGAEEVDVYANLTVGNDQEAAALNPNDELERLGIQVRVIFIIGFGRIVIFGYTVSGRIVGILKTGYPLCGRILLILPRKKSREKTNGRNDRNAQYPVFSNASGSTNICN